MTTTTTQAPAAPAPGTPEHDAAMAAKFNGAQAPADGSTATPAPTEQSLIGGKFKTQEDLLKAYQELEKKQSKPAEPPKPSTSTDALKVTQGDPAAADAVAKAGLDFDALTAEYNTGGKLSDETYKKFEDAGIPKARVDEYIAGKVALAEANTAKVYESAGGAEKYAEIMAWAGSNLSKAEIDAFNAQVDAGNMQAVQLAVAGIKARFEANYGTSHQVVQGKTVVSNTDVYASQAEMVADMRKPEYKNDPAFRAKVEAKVGRSFVTGERQAAR